MYSSQIKIITYVIGTVFLIGLLCQIILGMLYHYMIRQTENMTDTKNKLLKQIKVKFENNYNLNLGINNIPAFIEKYFYRYKFLGLHLNTWGRLSAQIILASGILAIVSFFLDLKSSMKMDAVPIMSISGDVMLVAENIFPVYIAIFILGSAVLMFSTHFNDVMYKQDVIKVNIEDYLENHLIPQLYQQKYGINVSLTPEEKILLENSLSSEENGILESSFDVMDEPVMEDTSYKNMESDDDEEEMIEELLREILS